MIVLGTRSLRPKSSFAMPEVVMRKGVCKLGRKWCLSFLMKNYVTVMDRINTQKQI